MFERQMSVMRGQVSFCNLFFIFNEYFNVPLVIFFNFVLFCPLFYFFLPVPFISYLVLLSPLMAYFLSLCMLCNIFTTHFTLILHLQPLSCLTFQSFYSSLSKQLIIKTCYISEQYCAGFESFSILCIFVLLPYWNSLIWFKVLKVMSLRKMNKSNKGITQDPRT